MSARLRYMVDTNVWIYAMNGRNERALRELTEHDKEEICISAVAYAELQHGMKKSRYVERNLERLAKVLEGVEILPFDEKAAAEYGKIKADLERKGELIGANDLLIAAHANSLDLVLVTNNIREFVRVEGLELADWSA